MKEKKIRAVKLVVASQPFVLLFLCCFRRRELRFQICMPFSKLKRTHKYDVSVKNALLVVVELLDQREMECSVANDSSAQECVNIVLNRLQVHAEGFYFGLQYLNKQKHR